MAEYSEKKKIKHLSPFGISRSLCETTLKSSQGKGHGTRYEQIVKRMGKSVTEFCRLSPYKLANTKRVLFQSNF